MRKTATVFLTMVFVLSLAGVFGCTESQPKTEQIVGTWAMQGDPSKTVSVTREGEQYYYTGSQGKMAATKVDENTLVVPMSGIEVTVALDPATGVLTVSFMGGEYQYTKVQQ